MDDISISSILITIIDISVLCSFEVFVTGRIEQGSKPQSGFVG